jgi:hypothetical protein
MTHQTEIEATTAPTRQDLERLLELESLPWYDNGVHNQDGSIDPKRKADMDEYNRIRKGLMATSADGRGK